MALEGRRVAMTGGTGAWRDAIAAGMAGAGAQLGPVEDGVTLVVHVAPTPAVDRPLSDVDEAAWDEAAEAPARDLLAVLQQAHRAAVPRVVVVIPSVSLEGAAGLVAETTGWEAMRLLAKSAARQWGRGGTTVNVVAPRLDGPPDAVRTDTSMPVDERALVDTVLLLASNEAAHVNGATLQPDGGALMLP